MLNTLDCGPVSFELRQCLQHRRPTVSPVTLRSHFKKQETKEFVLPDKQTKVIEFANVLLPKKVGPNPVFQEGT